MFLQESDLIIDFLPDDNDSSYTLMSIKALFIEHFFNISRSLKPKWRVDQIQPYIANFCPGGSGSGSGIMCRDSAFLTNINVEFFPITCTI